MIAIVSSNPRERTAFVALCESRAWPHVECDSLRAVKKMLAAHAPSVALIRHKLNDGYSDDVIAALRERRGRLATKALVLAGAGTPSAQEARQLALGADCVLRDPVRTDVLLEYLARFQQRNERRRTKASRPAQTCFRFAGARVLPLDRSIEHNGRIASLTPREVQLAEVLVEASGEIVTYTTLYSEILGRHFRGDTGNLRVLLGKLDASLRTVGIHLRNHVEVIPKTGYRYTAPKRTPLRLAKGNQPSESAAA